MTCIDWRWVPTRCILKPIFDLCRNTNDDGWSSDPIPLASSSSIDTGELKHVLVWVKVSGMQVIGALRRAYCCVYLS